MHLMQTDDIMMITHFVSKNVNYVLGNYSPNHEIHCLHFYITQAHTPKLFLIIWVKLRCFNVGMTSSSKISLL